MSDTRRPRRSGAHPRGLVLWLVVPAVAWLVATRLGLLDPGSAGVRRACRDLGYAALAALAVPYLYVWRRFSLHRDRGDMTRWVHWHIGASYLALGLTVVHARGQLFRGEVTGWVTGLFLAAVLSGVLGLLVQRVVFRLMALTIDPELGPASLAAECARLIDRAGALVENYSLLTEYDVLDWTLFCTSIIDPKSVLHKKVWESKWFPETPKQLIREAVLGGNGAPGRTDVLVDALNVVLRRPDFCNKRDFGNLAEDDEAYPLATRGGKDLADHEIERRNRLFLERKCPDLIRKSRKPPQPVALFFHKEVQVYLESGLPSWGWLFSPGAREPVSRNHYLRVRALVGKDEVSTIDQLWEWVGQRRRIDLEFWYHRLARVWLVAHAPAAWALLVLVVFHVASSIYFGGWF